METQIKLTKLASCAGCGAKVGAGTLAAMLEGFRTHTDPRLIVGYGKSDDACVYVVDPQTALVQTTDFFSPIVDDPFLYGQIAAANALSDVYAMGGEPKLALNILCLPETIGPDTVRELLRGGYDKVYEAGAVIAGGHTIHGAGPIYGLAVTGFGLLGHSFEMAQGSSCTIHLTADQVPYHPETLELADMGFLPAGAYRNRSYAESRRHLPPGDSPSSDGPVFRSPDQWRPADRPAGDSGPGLSCPAAGCHSLRRLHRLCHRTGGQLDRAGVTLRKTWAIHQSAPLLPERRASVF